MSFSPSLSLVRPLAARAGSERETLTFDGVYEAHFAFVWRTARRLGVGESDVSDVAQEVFLVVHRRLDSFEQRGSVKTWLYGILRRVVSDYRRSQRRKPSMVGRAEAIEPDAWSSDESDPAESAEQREAMALVNRLLDELDDDKREAFVLAELEGMTTSEIAEALDANPNTVASRIRAGRLAFEAALARHEAATERLEARLEGGAP
ncbi:MAG TPA: sigma-70 family RNA polymerase sigma factor [Polyangiaceae bacterium]